MIKIIQTGVTDSRLFKNNNHLQNDSITSHDLPEILAIPSKFKRNFHSADSMQIIGSLSRQNAAIALVGLFTRMLDEGISIKYSIPDINMDHIKKLTTDFGILRFSCNNNPDVFSGYTVDDNARALIAYCQHYELSGDESDLACISKYIRFIQFCQQPGGKFLKHVNEQFHFSSQNDIENTEDSNGNVIWAVGYLISMGNLLPEDIHSVAQSILKRFLPNVHNIHSPMAVAYIIKGLYYFNLKSKSEKNISIIKELANRLVKMYGHECHQEWYWFESSITYTNSLLPESLLCAWKATNDPIYKIVAKESFDFLLSKTFHNNTLEATFIKSKLDTEPEILKPLLRGEKPLDVAFAIMTLCKFYIVFHEKEYLVKMEKSFNWFLGHNHLSKIMYNPYTGGCYDQLAVDYFIPNQGAESTVSYLMARLTIEKVLWTESKWNTIELMSKTTDPITAKV